MSISNIDAVESSTDYNKLFLANPELEQFKRFLISHKVFKLSTKDFDRNPQKTTHHQTVQPMTLP